MPTVSVSIRNEDYDKWRALDSPAEFIHAALNGGLRDINIPANSNPPLAIHKVETEEDESDVDDFYATLVSQPSVNTVWDTATGEAVESSPEMIKELKRRSQIK